MKFKKTGSALIYSLVIMSVTMIILVSMIGYVTSQLKYSANRAEKEKALQIAEAGIYWYRWYLAHEVAGKTAEQINDFWQSGTAYGLGSPYEKDYFDPEGGAVGRYSIEIDAPQAHSTIIIVRSTGWTYAATNLKRTIRFVFVDHPGVNLRFWLMILCVLEKGQTSMEGFIRTAGYALMETLII